MDDEPVLVAQDVGVHYDRVVALEALSLRIDRPLALGIVGPNGAGKSTLLKAIAGLVRLARGSLRVLGRAPGTLPAGTIGYVPQIDELDRAFPLTVRDVVALGRYPRLRPLQRMRAHDVRAIDDALDRLELGPLHERRISDLSGGQQQRVLLARALAQEPRLLLLDEPTTGVDARTEAVLREVVRETAARGVPVLMTTHDLDDLADWFDRVIVVDRRVVADGTPAEIDSIAGDVLPKRTRIEH